MLTPQTIQNKNILLRLDLDIGLKNGLVENDFRLRAALPTIQFCLQHARKTIIIGHLGRPKGIDPSHSLEPIRKCLNSLLNQDIPLIPSGNSLGESWTGESPLALVENLRFDSREEKLDRGFALDLSQGADIYVYEAFATYHDSTSLTLIPEILPTVTGFRFDEEVSTLKKVLTNPLRPSLLLASGAKLDKLEIINQIAPKFDQVLLGGLLGQPTDRTPDGLDLNEETTNKIINAINQAKTIVFNGPLGFCEDGLHTKATLASLQAIVASDAFSVIGGGDTLVALTSLGFSNEAFGFVSTGGGAMLEYLSKGTHPLLETLKNAKLS